MLSRVADTLYWMRRYAERADHIARVVEVNLDLAFDRAPEEVARLWGRLLSALWAGPSWAVVERAGTGGALADLASFDAVAACVAAARENARQVRQHISADMWERLNALHLALNDPVRRAEWEERPHGYFRTVREGAALFDAAVHAGMARDQGWQFLQLGLFLERACGTVRLLACQLREVQPSTDGETLDEHLDWACLLRACDALELYRRRHGANLRPEGVVAFLLTDARAPRTVRYALDEIGRALDALADMVPGRPPVAVSAALAPAVDASLSRGADPLAAVSAVEAECDRVHRALYETYIDHRRAPAAVA
jgi:uncharacterized alpha-E superfamily protein